MMRWRLIGIVCLGCALFSITTRGQRVHSSEPRSQSEEPPAVNEYSATKLELARGKPVSGLERSQVVIRPLQCTAAGEILMEVPVPPMYTEFGVDSLSRSGGHAFDFKAIPELYNLTLISFFPSASDVYFLFRGAEENAVSDSRMMTDSGKVVAGKGNRAERHFYVVRFDSDGQYKSKARLADGPQYWKVAALASDELILLSYDPVNRVPLVQVTNSSGELRNSIALPSRITDYPALNQGQSDDLAGAKASTSVSSWQFIPVRNRVLMYRPKSHTPILEIGNGGYVREVPIAGPRGYELESFVASARHWLAIFRKSDLNEGPSGVDSRSASKNFVMAELNPNDGSLDRIFEMDRGSFFNIACEVDNQLVSYSTDMGSQFLLSYTDLPN